MEKSVDFSVGAGNPALQRLSCWHWNRACICQKKTPLLFCFLQVLAKCWDCKGSGPHLPHPTHSHLLLQWGVGWVVSKDTWVGKPGFVLTRGRSDTWSQKWLGMMKKLPIVAKLWLHLVKIIVEWHSYTAVKMEVSERFWKNNNIIHVVLILSLWVPGVMLSTKTVIQRIT